MPAGAGRGVAGAVGPVAGVVLAAGLSRRMGRPKQLLPYGDGTLLEHALAVACQSHLDDVMVVVSPEIARAVDLSGYPRVRVVANDAPERGQSGSLQLGLRAVPERAAGALVLMCDQPGVTSAAIDIILRAFGRGPVAAVVPTYNGRWGTPVLLGRTIWPEVMDLTGDAGAGRLLRTRPEAVRTVEVGDLADGTDIDTPAEYARLLEHRDAR